MNGKNEITLSNPATIKEESEFSQRKKKKTNNIYLIFILLEIRDLVFSD